jgi:DNA-directed RNA polymerase subunit RPC12/RpoP
LALPLIPHEFFGVNCCGCLVEIIGEETQFVCNECEAVIPAGDIHRAALEIESTEATCPHCGQINQISGLATVDAFICVRCGRGVGL